MHWVIFGIEINRLCNVWVSEPGSKCLFPRFEGWYPAEGFALKGFAQKGFALIVHQSFCVDGKPRSGKDAKCFAGKSCGRNQLFLLTTNN